MYWDSNFSTSSPTLIFWFCFVFNVSYLCEYEGALIMVWSCILLMTGDVEHFLMCLLNISIIFLYLYELFAHFLIELFILLYQYI